jgi:ribosome maturation factor RimP
MFEKLEEIAKAACARCGVGLYDIEIIKTQHGKVLCVFITKVGGVGINDCSNVSKELNIYLDTDDSLMSGPYTLEVSSPGVERALKFKKHYMSAINEKVKISFLNEGKKETVIGELLEVYQDFVVVVREGEKVQIAFSNIKKAKTVL